MDSHIYLHGRCHIFSLVLSQVFGYDMKLLFDHEAWFDERGETVGTALVHAYCVDTDGLMYDISGQITNATIQVEYECNTPDLITISSEELHRMMESGSLDKLDPGELEMLIEYIASNSQLYMKNGV